ncbi:sensor histidine kinase [Aestuariivirga litoralis]|uniref:histidine kinase n=1 Tax=Aestuariivirga litoralis TaxID=2650924 RepID=A0A2W2BNC1_9HYPH|nr:sensor histidine kinase [Aestuariivirga litoralis]PZF77749.1 sensor histidine kinase [Aestuariivirga litoralis]
MRPSSLSSRLILSSLVVSVVLLAATGLLLANLFTAALERNFDQRLRSVLDGLLANIEVTAEGSPRLSAAIVDPRFGLPLSGWYWQVVPVDKAGGAADLASNSLLEQRLTLPPELAGKEGVQGFYLTDTLGVTLRAIEQVFTLPGSTRKYSVLVAGNYDELSAEVRSFNRALVVSLVVLALGLALAVLAQVRFGLRPLRAMQANLLAIRQGGASELKGEYPAEIRPVAEELNLLIQSNAEIVERARTQVGNLAHALKTPLSVLTNEAAGQETPLAAKVAEQAGLMRDQVNLYLDRARRAARAQGLGAVTEVKPVLDALARTLERINRDKGVTVTVDCPDGLRFRGERQDLEEMVGNLLDNACKWAAGRVSVAARLQAATAGRSLLAIAVEDDGPGLPAEKRAEALKRGQRMDETKPGSGLGLSIVRETAAMYAGSVQLDDAALGGLRVLLTLPAVL